MCDVLKRVVLKRWVVKRYRVNVTRNIFKCMWRITTDCVKVRRVAGCHNVTLF